MDSRHAERSQHVLIRAFHIERVKSIQLEFYNSNTRTCSSALISVSQRFTIVSNVIDPEYLFNHAEISVEVGLSSDIPGNQAIVPSTPGFSRDTQGFPGNSGINIPSSSQAKHTKVLGL